MIRFQCNGCSKSLHAPDHDAGKTIRCPKCDESLDIPMMEIRQKSHGTAIVIAASLAAVAIGVGFYMQMDSKKPQPTTVAKADLEQPNSAVKPEVKLPLAKPPVGKSRKTRPPEVEGDPPVEKKLPDLVEPVIEKKLSLPPIIEKKPNKKKTPKTDQPVKVDTPPKDVKPVVEKPVEKKEYRIDFKDMESTYEALLKDLQAVPMDDSNPIRHKKAIQEYLFSLREHDGVKLRWKFQIVNISEKEVTFRSQYDLGKRRSIMVFEPGNVPSIRLKVGTGITLQEATKLNIGDWMWLSVTVDHINPAGYAAFRAGLTSGLQIGDDRFPFQLILKNVAKD